MPTGISTSHRPLTEIPASLRAFLSGLIDYAGLFPPARLPLEEAVTNYAAYRHTDDSWMLGQFICPARRLGELDVFTDLFEPQNPFPVSVLGSGGPDADGFFAALESDLADAAQFHRAHPGRVDTPVLEIRLPQPVVDAGFGAVEALLARTADLYQASAVRFEYIHFEAGFSGEWRRTIEEVASAIRQPPAGLPRLGLKLRCGGITPDLFPTPDQVAFLIASCRAARVPFKATAGLHHPVRHYDRGLEVMQHGFLNVFGAAVLAHVLELSEQAIRQIIRSETLKSFSFDADGFAFQDLRISAKQVEQARATFARSYGSCSFDEPRDDLRKAGVL